jgi:hypothetical protein
MRHEEGIVYDVRRMRAEIEDAVSIARQRVRDQFKSAFETIYRDNVVPQAFPAVGPCISIKPLVGPKDLDAIPAGAGFYIILSTFPVPDNECCLTCSGLRAIYRGECYTIRRRVQSHLIYSARDTGTNTNNVDGTIRANHKMPAETITSRTGQRVSKFIPESTESISIANRTVHMSGRSSCTG